MLRRTTRIKVIIITTTHDYIYIAKVYPSGVEEGRAAEEEALGGGGRRDALIRYRDKIVVSVTPVTIVVISSSKYVLLFRVDGYS